MGVVNVTPDSFSDGGRYLDPHRAIEHGLELFGQGAAIVDVGGQSTRPGSEPVSETVELDRVLPVVRGLADEGVVVSIDTSKPEIAKAALGAGAEIVNDVRAGRAAGMPELVANAGCGLVVMHMQGTPKTMQDHPHYEDVIGEIESFLLDRADALMAAGVDAGRIVIDPGFGFGKRLEHNLEILSGLSRLASHTFPVMLGTSRKGSLGALTGIDSPADLDLVTAVTTSIGFINGARVFRVHDVASSRHALTVTAAIVAAQ